MDLFFVISGFIMVYTTTIRHMTYRQFFWERVTRVVPIYCCATILTFLCVVLSPALVSHSGDYSSLDLLKSLFFIPYVKSNGITQPNLFVGWTLNFEMFFHVIFTLGLMAQSRRFWRQSIILLLIALTLIPLYWPVRNPILAFYTDPIIAEFALGMVVGLTWEWLAEREAIVKYGKAIFVISAYALARGSVARHWRISGDSRGRRVV